MLKHMLNTSAATSNNNNNSSTTSIHPKQSNNNNVFRNTGSSNSSTTTSTAAIPTGIPQSQLQSQQQPAATQAATLESDCGRLTTAAAQAATRYYVEPEYQNTTNVVGRVGSPFYRDIQLNKSARSAENVCLDSSSPQYKYNNHQWNPRRTPVRTTNITSSDSLHHCPMIATGTAAATRLPSRNSVLNHSYAPGTLYPHYNQQQQQQRSFSPNVQQRLNQSEIIGGAALLNKSFQSPIGANFDNVTIAAGFSSSGPTSPVTGGLLPNGCLVSTPKVIANGGLHISKLTSNNNNTTTVSDNKDSLLLDTSRLDDNKNVKSDHYNDNNNDNNNNNGCDAFNNNNNNNNNNSNNGVKEILTSLGLLCLISLLLALLSLIFLLKISPVTASDMKNLMRAEQFTVISPDEYVTVYEVTLALCALSLSLNLCCLLVCSVQFLFAVKLVRSSMDGDRTNKYLQKSAVTRVCAIAGFFISIPVFLTGVILYTFIQFHSTPAIITSVLIGSGIVFCGCAMVHNVFVWQKEKTNAVRAIVRRQRLHRQMEASRHSESSTGIGVRETSATALSTMSSLPRAGPVELSSVATTPHELSTLV